MDEWDPAAGSRCGRPLRGVVRGVLATWLVDDGLQVEHGAEYRAVALRKRLIMRHLSGGDDPEEGMGCRRSRFRAGL